MRTWCGLALAIVLLTTPLVAHHGSAAYHVDREIRVSGTVTAFRWINPHIRIVVAAPGENGTSVEWDGEGPPLTWAQARGWSASTLRAGERVTLVMYPARKESAREGLVKRIERGSGEVLPITRPWLGEGG
jgi:hypothetical protein